MHTLFKIKSSKNDFVVSETMCFIYKTAIAYNNGLIDNIVMFFRQ